MVSLVMKPDIKEFINPVADIRIIPASKLFILGHPEQIRFP